METRNIVLTLDKAKEWYNSSNEALKEAALQAYTEDELKEFGFRSIKTFEDACRVLYSKSDAVHIKYILMNIEYISKASVASFKLNIIRKALNKGYKMSLTKGDIWFPCNRFVAKGSKYGKQENEIEIAKFKIGNISYILFGGASINSSLAGLGYFYFGNSIGTSNASTGFLGCATKEIAEHFGKYFAKEIFEAKYGDFINYEWIN